MDFTLWISFVGTAVILTMTPGPSVLLATANSMAYGSKKTMATILGDLSANLCQIFLASLGLASIIVTSGTLFQWIKWLGVAYLILMGLRKIFTKPNLKQVANKKKEASFKSLYFEGFLMSAANPKAIVFFAALFPLFIDPNAAFIPQVLLLAITFLVLDGTSLLIYSKFAQKLSIYLQNQKKVHLQNRITGVLLIFSGLMLSLVKKGNS